MFNYQSISQNVIQFQRFFKNTECCSLGKNIFLYLISLSLNVAPHLIPRLMRCGKDWCGAMVGDRSWGGLFFTRSFPQPKGTTSLSLIFIIIFFLVTRFGYGCCGRFPRRLRLRDLKVGFVKREKLMNIKKIKKKYILIKQRKK